MFLVVFRKQVFGEATMVGLGNWDFAVKGVAFRIPMWELDKYFVKDNTHSGEDMIKGAMIGSAVNKQLEKENGTTVK